MCTKSPAPMAATPNIPPFAFFGTPAFAATILTRLAEAGALPIAVVCNPDKPAGRKQILTKPPAKLVAEQHHIAVLQPRTISELRNNSLLARAELFVVAAYAKILPAWLLTQPRYGTIGVHPSLLPKLRGPTPIQTAILLGAPATGVSIYQLDDKTDHGPILAQQRLSSYHPAHAATPSLTLQLAELGSTLLLQVLPQIADGALVPQPQQEQAATFTQKFSSQDGYVPLAALQHAIESGAGAPELDRKIRALNPEPGVYTLARGKRIKLLEASLDEKGRIRLVCIQKDGKTPQRNFEPFWKGKE
ncbi:methionyl-tRNA formyltransferase [Candidatus Parcubacteria bacterium]|nr:MAG: methionyl-tRNA formyltransferase [Candidatus Parcubacteria bacterium]